MSAASKTVCAPCLRGHHDTCTVGAACGCETCNPPAVVWEEPPATQRGGRGSMCPITTDQRDELKAHPKRWARIHDYPSKSSANATKTRIGKAAYPDLPPDEWEVTTRVNGTGSVLYARYIGPTK